MALDLAPRSAQQCAAFYYTDWRRGPGYVDARGRPDLKEVRVDQALRRREHAWFHFWRFDEGALGPCLPPAAVRVQPVVLHSAQPLAPLRSRSGNAAAATAQPPSLGDAKFVLPSLAFGDAFQLPYICPAVEVLIDADGLPVDPPPHSDKKPGEPPPAVLDAIANMADTSEARAALAAAVSGGSVPPPATAAQLTLLALAERQHVDPLHDYSRLLAAAATALASAAGAAKAPVAAGGLPGPSSCDDAPAEAALLAHTPHTFSDSWVDDRFIDNESFCALCGDGGELMCCDGACRRSFHVHCVKSNESALRATVKASPALQQQAAAVPMLLAAGTTGSALDGAAAASAAAAGAQAASQLPVPAQRGPFAGVFDFGRDDWRCSSCVTGEHSCYVCGVAGLEGVSVFRCSRMCGKYYHTACLALNPLTRWLTPAPGADTALLPRVPLTIPEGDSCDGGAAAREAQLGLLYGAVGRSLSATPFASRDGGAPRELLPEPLAAVRFVCPFHTCGGCRQAFDPFHPPLYYRCHACPTAYHVNCVPPDARWDMVRAACASQ